MGILSDFVALQKVYDLLIIKLILDSSTNTFLLVMEYANSGTLQNYLEENFTNLSWYNKFGLALQLTRAVSFLHDKGIVHRDLVNIINYFYTIASVIYLTQFYIYICYI